MAQETGKMENAKRRKELIEEADLLEQKAKEDLARAQEIRDSLPATPSNFSSVMNAVKKSE